MDWSALPPLNALRAFAAVAELRSLTRAGDALNVTHSAVRQQIQNLEAHLGLRLVSRKGRGMTLTEQGAALSVTLNAAFADISMAVEALSDAEAIRPLQVSMTQMFAVGILMPHLASFCDAHPDIELKLNPTIEAVELAPGGVDVAIRFGTGQWPGLQTEMLMPCCLTVVAAKSLIGDRVFTDPTELVDYPLLQELDSDEFADWLDSQGVAPTPKRKVVHMPGNLLLDALRRGDGIVATVPQFIEADLEGGNLVILFDDPIPNIGYYIVTRPGIQRAPLQTFIRWLKTVC